MLPLTLDEASRVPAYRQICHQIAALADSGALRPGERLPSTRILGPDLGVHRSTVIRAYDELRALGYLESRPGSYTTVRRRERPHATSREVLPEAEPGVIDWATLAGPGVRALDDHPGLASPEPVPPDGAIDLHRLSADPTLAPEEDLRRCLKAVLLRSGGRVLDYADVRGWRPLREVLATRMARHGVAADPEEILITSGAQQALDLLLRYLTTPRDTVIVEAPTYRVLHPLLTLHGLRPVEIEMGDEGMDLDHLERVLRASSARRPRLVYTMPTFQNPTGITTDAAHRERLLLLCEEYGVPLVEDGFEEEMKYTGRAVLPLKSMDRHGVVLYVGTFSKVVFPGLRVGWIVAPRRAVPPLAGIQRASSLAVNTVAQAAAAHFCVGGAFEVYLRRVHRVYRRRMRVLLDALERHMPAGVRWTRPRGGYTAWVTLPGGREREDAVVSRLAAAGVLVGAGRQFYGRLPEAPHVRLSIACADEAAIEVGCSRLGAVLRDVSTAERRLARGLPRAHH